MGQQLRDFTITGLAVLPGLLWILTGSVEAFAVTSFFMLLVAITAGMAAPPSSDPPE